MKKEAIKRNTYRGEERRKKRDRLGGKTPGIHLQIRKQGPEAPPCTSQTEEGIQRNVEEKTTIDSRRGNKREESKRKACEAPNQKRPANWFRTHKSDSLRGGLNQKGFDRIKIRAAGLPQSARLLP